MDAGEAVGGDDVGGGRVRTAEEGAGRAIEEDAVGEVSERGQAAGGGADQVALDDVARRACAQDLEADGAVGGDQVALAGSGAADQVGRSLVDEDAVEDVSEPGSAGGVGTDEVALDDVCGGACKVELDADSGIAADDVASLRITCADDIGRGVIDEDAGKAVSEGAGAGGIGTDVVAQDEVSGGVGLENNAVAFDWEVAQDLDSGGGVAAEQVTGGRGIAADQVVGGVDEGEAVVGVRSGLGTGGVGAQVVALDGVVARADEEDAGGGEAADGEPLDGAGPRGDDQAAGIALELGAGELDPDERRQSRWPGSFAGCRAGSRRR